MPQSWTLQLALHAQQDRYKAQYEPTDAWNAERSSAGQRALRIGGGKWVPVPAASRGAGRASGPPSSSTQRASPAQLKSYPCHYTDAISSQGLYECR